MFNFLNLFILTHIIFILSLIIFLNNKNNILIMFIISELLNISGTLNYLFFFYYFQNYAGESLILIMFALGAAEAAIDLVLIINFVKLQNTLTIL